MDDIFVCPHCGQEVKARAKACPHCGSDKDTGWSKETDPDDSYAFTEEDYQDAVRREFGARHRGITIRQILTGGIVILLVILFILYMIK